MKRVVAFAVLALFVVLGLSFAWPDLYGQSKREVRPAKAVDSPPGDLKNMTMIYLNKAAGLGGFVDVIRFNGVKTVAGRQFIDVVTKDIVLVGNVRVERRMLISIDRVEAIELKNDEKK